MSASKQVRFDDRGDVMIIDLSEWDGNPASIQDSEQELAERDRNANYAGYVTDLGGVSLSKETQRHIAESWSSLIEELNGDQFAYVSEGIEAMAATAQIQSNDNVETFESVTEAIDWIRG
ncbi:MAG: hypothetical protein ABEI98_01105 [Halorhabdus sp.]